MVFWKRDYSIFIELGNYYIRSSLIKSSFSSNKVVKQIERPNSFYKNGIIRNKDAFIECMKDIVTQYSKNYSQIIVGFDSTYIKYNGFEYNGAPKCDIANLSSLLDEDTIIHHKYDHNHIATLSIQRLLLDKVYSTFNAAKLEVSKFVSTSYLKALTIPKQKMTMVLNMGYRATNIMVFKNDFLILYKTLPLGIENAIIPIAKKYEMSVNESLELVSGIDLKNNDSRLWVECGYKSLTQDEVVESVRFYLDALVQKILNQGVEGYGYVDQTIVTDWGSRINGIDQILHKYIKNMKIYSDTPNPHASISNLVLN